MAHRTRCRTGAVCRNGSPGRQWQDSGWQRCRIVTGQIDHQRGLALVHPVQYYLGRLAIRRPGIEPALAITWVSSIAGAVAVANVALTLSLLVPDDAGLSWSAPPP